jgi:hypothetical protein
MIGNMTLRVLLQVVGGVESYILTVNQNGAIVRETYTDMADLQVRLNELQSAVDSVIRASHESVPARSGAATGNRSAK